MRCGLSNLNFKIELKSYFLQRELRHVRNYITLFYYNILLLINVIIALLLSSFNPLLIPFKCTCQIILSLLKIILQYKSYFEYNNKQARKHYYLLYYRKEFEILVSTRATYNSSRTRLKILKRKFWNLPSIDICNLFLGRDSDTHCAFPHAITRRIFRALF